MINRITTSDGRNACGSSLLTDDVFVGVVGDVVLANGVTARVVVAGPADVASVRDFYDALSDTSTYYRFFGIRRALPDRELTAVVSTMLPDRVTLLARLGDRLIGIGEYIASPRAPGEAEVAFAVADDHHREGVATLLLERLAIVAHRCGLHTLTAVVLPGNGDMQLVFRTVGLPVQSRFDDAGGVVDVTLDITDLDHLLQLSAARHDQAMAACQPHDQLPTP
jgi:GNAT superfamily N-acetyltransferase